MINPADLRQFVIGPVLKSLGLYSPSAETLLVLTSAVESAGGQYLHQLGSGPACGIYQMEPRTHDDIWERFLRYRAGGRWNGTALYLAELAAPGQDELADRVRAQQIPGLYHTDNAREMCGNLYYATAMCRMHYLRVPTPLPEARDIRGLADYWKAHYNTPKGAGTVARAVDAYERMVSL